MSKDEGVGRDPAGQALVSDGAASVSTLSGFDPSRCRNCGGEGWVCENHQDTPWEASGHASDCGAGAPCPVCNREMACAPYVPWWQPMATAPKDGTEVLITGGVVFHPDDWTNDGSTFVGVAIAHWDSTWREWEGASVRHDENLTHEPDFWMPLPGAISDKQAELRRRLASGMETRRATDPKGRGPKGDSPTGEAGDAQEQQP